MANSTESVVPAAASVPNPYISGIVSGAGSIISTGIQAYVNKKEAARQREWNEQMMDKQNQWSLDMWNRTNEYNSPSAQVQRLRDAGLNPLYYGLDGSSANGFESAQPLGYERAQLDNVQNPFAAGMAAAVQSAQVSNIQAQTEKIKSETGAINAKLPFEVESLKAQVRQSNLSSDAQEIVNKYLDSQQQAEVRMKNSTSAQADSVVQKAAAEIEKMDYEKTTMYIGWLETYEKILNLQKQRELSDKQIEELASLISVNNQQAKKIGLDISNYDDITVIGTASHTMRFGPFTVQEGQPITLAMKKAAEEHLRKEREKREANDKEPVDPGHNKRRGEYRYSDKSDNYSGPIYD